jgi:aspartate aminotransferase
MSHSISEAMLSLTQRNSTVRAMFEEGKRLASIHGPENVFDFSIGNPYFPAPNAVNQAIKDILDEHGSLAVHGYMSNAGYEDVREAVAGNLNRRYGTELDAGNILMTVGAAGGLNVILKTLLNEGDEVVCFAPFFLEYGNYIANYGGKLVVVPPNAPSFQPLDTALAEAVTPRTKAVIINSPNNPTGVIYSEDTLKRLAAVLERKQAEYGKAIFILSDEPYRELAYDGASVPWLTKIYRNTVVCYSWSKSLSLPGERIGYLVIPSEAEDSRLVYEAASIANRILGFVNAPSLIQRAVARCLDESTDLSAYDANRRLLYESLSALGFDCAFPQGTFYLWLRAPGGNDVEFAERAKAHNILLVPGTSFMGPGYVRIAYCVSRDTIERALPKFKLLAEELEL